VSFIELKSKIKFLEIAETEVFAKRVKDVHTALFLDSGYSVVSAVGMLRGISRREENICQVLGVAFV
jgi:hypothetical protein